MDLNGTEDAQITFVDGSALQNWWSPPDNSYVNWAAGHWTDTEIEAVDVALEAMHLRTDNTRLLRTAFGSQFEFTRQGAGTKQTDGNGSVVGGWNSGGGDITFTDNGISPAWLIPTVWHETGHNWDSVYEQMQAAPPSDPNAGHFWTDFTNISWPGGVRTGSLADFARDYGMTNANEDWSTIWEIAFNSLWSLPADKRRGTCNKKGHRRGFPRQPRDCVRLPGSFKVRITAALDPAGERWC